MKCDSPKKMIAETKIAAFRRLFMLENTIKTKNIILLKS